MYRRGRRKKEKEDINLVTKQTLYVHETAVCMREGRGEGGERGKGSGERGGKGVGREGEREWGERGKGSGERGREYTITHLYQLGHQIRVHEIVWRADGQQDERDQVYQSRVVQDARMVPGDRETRWTQTDSCLKHE